MVEVRNFIKGKAQKVVSTTESAYRKVEGYVDNKMQQVERNSLDRDLRNEKNDFIDWVSGVLDYYRKKIDLKGTQAQENPQIKLDINREIERTTEHLPELLTKAVDNYGYNNMYNFKQHLKQNWRSLTKENIAQYLNNMKNPPFPYYYNTKKARKLSKKIDGFYTYEKSVMKTLKTDQDWCENPLSDDMIVSKIKGLIIRNNYVKKTIEQHKDQEKKETENEIEKTMEELHKLIIKELNNCSNLHNFLNVKLSEILEDNISIRFYYDLKFQLKKYLEAQNMRLPGEDTNKWIDIKSGLEKIIDHAFKGNGKISSASISIAKGKRTLARINKNKKTNGDTNEAGGEEGEAEGEEVDIESEEVDIESEENEINIFEEIQSINYSNLSLGELRNEILNIFMDNGIDLKDDDIKSDIYARYGSMIEAESFDEDMLCDQPSIVMTYALACNIDDINNESDLRAFIQTVKSYGKSGKYAEKYRDFLAEMGQYYDNCIEEIAIQSLIERYYVANAVADGRNFYESDFINFAISTAEGQTQTGLYVASNIDNIDSKLNHYGFKANRSEHEEAALKYTAFDITFKNTFNLNNPIIEKLAAQQVDLRDDLFKYDIYISENNYFNKEARDRYISEKLQPLGLAPEEIDELGNAIAGLPLEVENNYKILSGNFDADQNNFEKITKIFALGEVIDHIKNLFTNGEILSDNVKLGTVIGFELDENEPADIVGDYLFLKGKVNGTETKIKYDLRTGKLYMNSFTQQELHPPKITIGNGEPNTEIGDIGNFDDLLDGYQPTSFKQNEGIDYTQTSNDNMIYDEKSDEQKPVESDSQDKNQKTLEELMENKLLEKLAIIGETVKKKTGEQSKENNIIDEFLKTFNILPDTGEPKDIEFMGGSELYILLDSIKNTNDEDYLLKFSKLMSELMTFCGFTRGKNNLLPKDSGFDSITIFDIDEKDATTDIISLKRANKNFFSEQNGEKDKIKGCEQHFDSSVKLSFADIIVKKCCRRFGDGWQISINHAQDFVDSIKKGIENIKHDENDVVAMENMIEDESLWA